MRVARVRRPGGYIVRGGVLGGGDWEVWWEGVPT